MFPIKKKKTLEITIEEDSDQHGEPEFNTHKPYKAW